MQLKDKVALVTGANGGLGRAIVKTYMAAGAKVVAADRSEMAPDFIRQLDELGGEYLALQCDITSSQQVKEMFDKTIERFGTLDILVNNAGKTPTDPVSAERRRQHYELITKPIPRRSLQITMNISDEEWKSYFDVNIHGAFYCTREALKIMEPKKYGRIINIASTAGISVTSIHSPHYSASKAALVGFTRSVAAEVAGNGILVNCIAPGGIMTPDFRDILDKMGEQGRNEFYQIVPLGRLGEPEEYASLALWLASDDGGSYLAGQVISPNGGAVM